MANARLWLCFKDSVKQEQKSEAGALSGHREAPGGTAYGTTTHPRHRGTDANEMSCIIGFTAIKALQLLDGCFK